MIDVSQWRSSIGLWCSSCQPVYSVKSSTALVQSEREQLLSSLIEILLILSGNVELNPGPKTDDVHVHVCKIIQDVLRKNFADLSEAIKHCVPRTAELMYSSELIEEYQVDPNNRQSMIDEFNKKMPFKNDVYELQNHCQLFLDCLTCQDGPPLEVAQRLAKMWTERIQQELKISLSFEIKHVQPMETPFSSTCISSSKDPIMAVTSPQLEQSTHPIMAAASPQMDQSTHPIMAAASPQMDQSTHLIMAAYSPQMDQSTHPIMAATSPQMDQSTHPIMAATSPQMDQSTHPIMAATSPQVDQLLDWLRSLVEWEYFAIYLPGMTNNDVEIIKKDEKTVKDQKRALYSKWLEVCPTASWNDVITALERDRKMTLADDVRQKLTEIQSSTNSLTDNRNEDISLGTDNHMEFSPQSRDGEAVNAEPIEVTLLPNEEKEIEKNLINLHNKFTRLEGEFKKGLKQFIKNERGTILDIIDYIERFTRSDDPILRSSITIDDLMRRFNNYYDFLECRVLAETAENFVSPDLACEFQTHLHEAKQFRNSASVKTLREHLNKIYKPYIHNPENAPKALIDMHTAWDDVTIEGLYKLMRRFYPRNYSLLNNIKITASSVHIVYYITESQDEIKQIIEHCQQNVSIMRYIGIFGLEINGVIILDDQHEDEHYTFESGLLKAAEDGNNEAVQFLVELGIDVNHVTEEGQTPLTLAITNGHRHVMETLISAGANVNPQVKWTPLAIAVKREDPIELTRYLLDHGAHCNVLINGTSILDMTSHEETHQLLYQHNAMTTQRLIAFRYFKLRHKLRELTEFVQKFLNDLLSAGNITLIEVKDQVVDYISPQPDTSVKCDNLDEFFVLLQSFCSIFNVNPFKTVAEKFLGSEIMADFDDYLMNLNEFEMSAKLCHMVHIMSVPSDIQPASSNVTIKFNSQWKDRSLAEVRKLHEQCFASIHQFLTLADMNEEDSKIILTYKIPSSPQCSPVISTEQQQFMKQVGIHEVIVDDVVLLVNDDNQEVSIKRTFTSKTQAEQFMMYSAIIGDNDAVKSLLDQNLVDINYCDKDGMTPLMMAACFNHLNVIETFLLAGASKLVNHHNNDGLTPLMYSSSFGHLEVVKCLLRIEEIDVNFQDTDGFTALKLAILCGHLEIVECLLVKQADPNLADDELGLTALMMYILAYDSFDINQVNQLIDSSGINIIPHLTCQRIPMKKGLELLLDANACPVVTLPDGREMSSLTIAALANNLDAINVLMRRVEFSNELITHALIVACYVGNPLVINALSCMITNLPNKELLLSCAEGDIAGVISAIYESNVNPDTRLLCGLTPFMVASSCGHVEIVDALIQAGADINLPNDNGNTPLDIVDHKYVVRPPNQDVISILVEHGATHENPVNINKLILCYPTNNLEIDEVPSSTELNILTIIQQMLQNMAKIALMVRSLTATMHRPLRPIDSGHINA